MYETYGKLAKAIAAYVAECAHVPGTSPGELGLRHLLPMLQRYYFINLRTTLDRNTGNLNRGLWMHFPHSCSGWPDRDGVSQDIAKFLRSRGIDTSAKGGTIDSINWSFWHHPDLHYNFGDVQILDDALFHLNDIHYDPERLQERTREYVPRLAAMFGPDGEKPDDYSPDFYAFEKQQIYHKWDDHSCWVFFPIFSQHLWVTLLAARIPTEDLEEVSHLLPMVSGVIAQSILSHHLVYGWPHPVNAVLNETELISLMSIVAAQCGLRGSNPQAGLIRFSGERGGTLIDRALEVRVPGGARQFVFNIPAERASYFDRIWRTCLPVLKRYEDSAANRSRVAKASLMSRNFSHNVGSHALANPRLGKSLGLTDATSASRLSAFHSYAQGRLDFMARAISGADERAEPLFFIGDVLSGFFRQGVLLDTLLDDTGFPAEKINFTVEICNDGSLSKAKFRWDGGMEPDGRTARSHTFVRESGGDLVDVLVGMPGGSIGCHALYALLENCLRNAVKYGARSRTTECLEISIRLEKSRAYRQPIGLPAKLENAWILRLADNVSFDLSGSGRFGVSRTIRRYINTPLLDVDESGSYSTEGHGIQEMKVCAETLAGGAGGLRFPADNESLPEGGCKACGDVHAGPEPSACAEYRQYLEAYSAHAKAAAAEARQRAAVVTAERARRAAKDAAFLATRHAALKEAETEKREDAEMWAFTQATEAEQAYQDDATDIHAGLALSLAIYRETYEAEIKAAQGTQGGELCMEWKSDVAIRHALRCFSSGATEEVNRPLIYHLVLPCPVLLGLIELSSAPGARAEMLPEFVRRFDSLQSLASTGAQFAVILDPLEKIEKPGEDPLEEMLTQVANSHPALPFRLFVLTVRRQTWVDRLAPRVHRDGKFTQGVQIPSRRLRIVDAAPSQGTAHQLLHALLAGPSEDAARGMPAFPSFLGTKGWEAVMLRVCDTWLRAFKGEPPAGRQAEPHPTWKLCIGFERNAEQVLGRWKDLLESFGGVGSCISVHIVARESARQGMMGADFVCSQNSPMQPASEDAAHPAVTYFKAKREFEEAFKHESQAPLGGKSFLLYDNHGKVFELKDRLLEHAPRFHQEIGLNNALGLYQALESPPSSPFGSAYLIYSLTEAALTRFAVVDERVSQSTIEELLLLRSRGVAYQRAGIFPLISMIRSDGKYADANGPRRRFLSPMLEDAALKTYGNNDPSVLEEFREGVVFTPQGLQVWAAVKSVNSQVVSRPLHLQGMPADTAERCDVLIIHEGVTDVLHTNQLWEPDDVWKLYEAFPVVTRTSGRGHDSRYLGKSLPFLEFSELSENTYRNLNKAALNKSVLGVAGFSIVPVPEKKDGLNKIG